MAGIEIATGELMPPKPDSIIPLKSLVIRNKSDASAWLLHISALLGNWQVEASPYISSSHNCMMFEFEMFMNRVAENIGKGSYESQKQTNNPGYTHRDERIKGG